MYGRIDRTFCAGIFVTVRGFFTASRTNNRTTHARVAGNYAIPQITLVVLGDNASLEGWLLDRHTYLIFQVDLTRQHIMSSYYKKVQAVRNQKMLFDKLRQMRHPVGFIMRPVHYTKMYSEWFKEYFIYKVLGDSGPVLPNGKTQWGLDVKAIERSKQTFDRGLEMPHDWEYPVHLTELEAWLEKNYGNLAEVEDYQYLADILLASNAVGSQPAVRINQDRALQWLQAKKEALIRTPDAANAQKVEQELDPVEDSSFEWNIPDTEFVELALALITSGAMIVPKRGRDATIERMAKALGVTLGSPVRVIIRNIKTLRNEDRAAPLLTRMLTEFMRYINKEKE